MSHLTELIMARASTRAFDGRSVPREVIREIVEAARWAPSACNAQPWRFVAVTDPALREAVALKGLGGAVPNRWARQAGAFLVACAERRLFPHRLAEPLAGISYHQVDLGIAMEHAVLRATELGVGSCYIGWFRERPLRHLLGLPRAWKIICILALGYTAVRPPPRERLPLEDILFFDRVGKEASDTSGRD